jgi:hypothetical protein
MVVVVIVEIAVRALSCSVVPLEAKKILNLVVKLFLEMMIVHMVILKYLVSYMVEALVEALVEVLERVLVYRFSIIPILLCIM